MFYPGETVAHEFIVPFSCETENGEVRIEKIFVTYKQRDKVILVKPVTDLLPYRPDLEGPARSKLAVRFTQQDALLFDENCNFTIQINILFNNGTRVSSNEIKSSTGVQHYKDVITNG